MAEILGEAWNISQQGKEIITLNNTIKDKATITKNALDADFKEIGRAVISKIQNKNNVDQVVLQIQKIRNISAPKANEHSQAAPRMLKLVLTDGESYIQAIEITPIPFLNPDKTPPGSKLLIRSAKISSGYLLLEPQNCNLLGGRVPALYEKWEVAKTVQTHNRQNASSDGAPAWVNFGGKIQSDVQEKPFKSLDDKKEERDNTKFDMQRQDAIAEAASGAVRKVFGGGSKQPVQPSFPKPRKEFPPKERKTYKKMGNQEEEEKPQKPLERVSLFDFLEDKLPANEVNIKPAVNNEFQKSASSYQQNNKNQNYNNNRRDQNNSYRARNDIKTQGVHKYNENLVNGLSDNLGKMSINNTQFASRSLKQHLNIAPQRKNNDVSNAAWKVDDECLAKYWEDGKFYNAIITAITDKTYAVRFKGYGNIEEVLKSDCLPVGNNETAKKPRYSGPVEFKRSRPQRRQ